MATCVECDRPADGGRDRCENHYAVLRYRLKAYGRWDPDRVDPEAARNHLALLRDWGMGIRRLEQLTGLSRPTLQAVPTVGFITRNTHHAILSVPLPESVFDPVLADGTQISSLGSRRRLRALSAIGWDAQRVAEQLGVMRHRVQGITGGSQPKVTVARARAIAELFSRLQMTEGPSAKARRVAQIKGWPLPFQWDEDELDNPNAVAYVNRPKSVRTSVKLAELLELGVTDTEVLSERLGVQRQSVERQLSRMAAAS